MSYIALMDTAGLTLEQACEVIRAYARLIRIERREFEVSHAYPVDVVVEMVSLYLGARTDLTASDLALLRILAETYQRGLVAEMAFT